MRLWQWMECERSWWDLSSSPSQPAFVVLEVSKRMTPVISNNYDSMIQLCIEGYYYLRLNLGGTMLVMVGISINKTHKISNSLSLTLM